MTWAHFCPDGKGEKGEGSFRSAERLTTLLDERTLEIDSY